jgi:hypothetical protein
MQLTSEDGLGVPFVSLWLFITAQLSRSASGQDTKTILTAGSGKVIHPTSMRAPELYPLYPARSLDSVDPGIQPV